MTSDPADLVLTDDLVLSRVSQTPCKQQQSKVCRRPNAKRLFDIVATVILLAVSSPLLISLAIIMLVSNGRGRVFYKHERLGRYGKLFKCVKFCTMCVDADSILKCLLEDDPVAREEWKATGKLKNDPRVSPIGKFLRSTSLDELPQLWNVLNGDMSLVGPRPITSAEAEGPYNTYGGRDGYLSVRPGITGLWQISGRSGVGYEERVALDQRYVETQSFAIDVSIICRTLIVVLRRDGAW